jgi:hypothetical protein
MRPADWSGESTPLHRYSDTASTASLSVTPRSGERAKPLQTAKMHRHGGTLSARALHGGKSSPPPRLLPTGQLLRDLDARRPASARFPAANNKRGSFERTGTRPASPSARRRSSFPARRESFPAQRRGPPARHCISPPPSAAAVDAAATLARGPPIARRQSAPGVPHSIARPAAVAAATVCSDAGGATSARHAPLPRGAAPPAPAPPASSAAAAAAAAAAAELWLGEDEHGRAVAPFGFPFRATSTHDELGFPHGEAEEL